MNTCFEFYSSYKNILHKMNFLNEPFRSLKKEAALPSE